MFLHWARVIYSFVMNSLVFWFASVSLKKQSSDENKCLLFVKYVIHSIYIFSLLQNTWDSCKVYYYFSMYLINFTNLTH